MMRDYPGGGGFPAVGPGPAWRVPVGSGGRVPGRTGRPDPRSGWPGATSVAGHRPAERAAWQAGGVIVGIGVDLVDIARLDRALRRTPALAARLFTEGERAASAASLAACFAAKEAVAKALGAPAGLRWPDVEVGHDQAGRPVLSVRGTVADAAHRLGVRQWHVSLTHDGGVSVAFVVAED
jgi:holo-[acyl-carrier protein] synthase